MINRVLIRIKVLQILFAYQQNGSNDLKLAENELLLSLRRSYDLYYYFLLLIVEVTHLQERRLDMRRNRYRPAEEDLRPNTRLVDNRFARQIEANLALQAYVKEHGISWANETDFVKSVLDLILGSEIYAQYLGAKTDSYEVDRDFWRAVFRRLICGNESLEDALEDISIYWNDDIEIIETFVIKTIKYSTAADGPDRPLLPMFKDAEDRDYAIRLLHLTMLRGQEYLARIDRHLKNWESDRVASMDRLIMQMAVAELINFPTIPVNVTLNEYIDAAKYYSTPKSSTFINGILDAVVQDLKEENKLVKVLLAKGARKDTDDDDDDE